MGAWGEGPTENDTAADLASCLDTKTIYEMITEGLGSKDVEAQRHAAWLITRLGDPIIYAAHRGEGKMLAWVEVATDKMKALLADEEWISEWQDETEIREAVQKQIDDLLDLVWEPK